MTSAIAFLGRRTGASGGFCRSTLLVVCASLCAAAPAPAQEAVELIAAATATGEDPLVKLVDEAITVTKHRHLDFQQHTPWQILHGLLALRQDYTLRKGDQTVNALEYLSTEARFKGKRWFEASPHGARAQPYNGTPYDFEGHVNQTLAIISMCDVPLEHQFVLEGGKTATMADMIRHAQAAVNTREEIAWTLWFLTHYVDQDAQWTNAAGQRWSMEQLVRMQTKAGHDGAPCGGCHGLFALAYARNSYLQKHGQLRGAWLEADQRIQQYVAAAKSMQNRDGSFATEFFKARGYSNEFNERIKSSGHMLEWLMMALPKKRLEEPWVRLGVQTLANDLKTNASKPAECGPLYHALHALVLYRQRVQPETKSTPPSDVASTNSPQIVVGPVTSAEPDGESQPRLLQDGVAQAQPLSPMTSGSVGEATAVPAEPVATTPGETVNNPAVNNPTTSSQTAEAATLAAPPQVTVSADPAATAPDSVGPGKEAPRPPAESSTVSPRTTAEAPAPETKSGPEFVLPKSAAVESVPTLASPATKVADASQSELKSTTSGESTVAPFPEPKPRTDLINRSTPPPGAMPFLKVPAAMKKVGDDLPQPDKPRSATSTPPLTVK